MGVLRVRYAVFVCNLLALVGLALTLGDQVAKAAAYVDAPGVRTDGVALIRGNEAYVRKSNFCFAVFLGDFKDNVGIVPLALVHYEVEVVICNMPFNRYYIIKNRVAIPTYLSHENSCIRRKYRYRSRSDRSTKLKTVGFSPGVL